MSVDTPVRIAWPDDAPAIAAVQWAAWSERFPQVPVPGDVEAMSQAWATALTRTDDARRRILVALADEVVVGFALTSPATDPDCDPIQVGELAEFTVAGDARGSGHGTRLLQAGIDTLEADHFTRAVTWVSNDDDPLRRLLTSSGWAADGAHRELADESGHSLRQVRLHTSIG